MSNRIFLFLYALCMFLCLASTIYFLASITKEDLKGFVRNTKEILQEEPK